MSAEYHPVIAIPDRGCDERRSARMRLNLAGMMTSPMIETTIISLMDLSSHGCRICADTRAKIGSLVTLSVPGITSVSGWVAWRKGDEIGIDFANPLPRQVVEYTLSRN